MNSQAESAYIKYNQSEEWNIDEFLKRGGRVIELDNFGKVVSKIDDIEELIVKSNTNSATEKSKQGKEERLAYQRPFMIAFNEGYTKKTKWGDLAERSGNVVSSSLLRSVFNGRSTVLLSKRFEHIVKVSQEMIDEEFRAVVQDADKIEQMKKQGYKCEHQIKRIIKQRPILENYVAKMNNVSCYRLLSERLKNSVCETQLRSVAKGKTSIKREDLFRDVEKAINEMLRGLK